MTDKNKKPSPAPDKETMAREMMGGTPISNQKASRQTQSKSNKDRPGGEARQKGQPKKPALKKEKRKPAGPEESLEDLRQSSAAEKSINRAVVTGQADPGPGQAEEVEEKAMEASIYQVHSSEEGHKNQRPEEGGPRTGGREVRPSQGKSQKKDQAKSKTSKNQPKEKKGGHLLSILIFLLIILLVFFFIDKIRDEKALTGRQALAGESLLAGSLVAENRP